MTKKISEVGWKAGIRDAPDKAMEAHVEYTSVPSEEGSLDMYQNTNLLDIAQVRILDALLKDLVLSLGIAKSVFPNC